MKIILIKDVKGRGKKGDVIEVASGYGNYLLTSKHAIEASAANLQSMEDEKKQRDTEAKQEYDQAILLKARVEASPIKLFVKIGETGKLFGAVNTKQIAEELKKSHNIEIDKRKILLDDNLHALGSYEVPIRLHKDVLAKIHLQVLEEE